MYIRITSPRDHDYLSFVISFQNRSMEPKNDEVTVLWG